MPKRQKVEESNTLVKDVPKGKIVLFPDYPQEDV